LGKALKGNHYVHQNLFLHSYSIYDVLGVGNPKISCCLAYFLDVFVGFHLDLLPSVVMINDVMDFPILDSKLDEMLVYLV